jgi:hypothetical protein
MLEKSKSTKTDKRPEKTHLLYSSSRKIESYKKLWLKMAVKLNL